MRVRGYGGPLLLVRDWDVFCCCPLGFRFTWGGWVGDALAFCLWGGVWPSLVIFATWGRGGGGGDLLRWLAVVRLWDGCVHGAEGVVYRTGGWAGWLRFGFLAGLGVWCGRHRGCWG